MTSDLHALPIPGLLPHLMSVSFPYSLLLHLSQTRKASGFTGSSNITRLPPYISKENQTPSQMTRGWIYSKLCARLSGCEVLVLDTCDTHIKQSQQVETAKNQ